MKYPEFWHRQRKLRLLKLLNKVWDLGLVLLRGCSGGAHKSQERVGFWRGYRARGLTSNLPISRNKNSVERIVL